MLKQINKDNLLKTNGIDPNKYNSDRVYKMIKKNKIPYNSLNKDNILTMILNFEKNNKGGKLDTHLLKSKTARRKGGKVNTNTGKENLYEEKINKRKTNQPDVGNLSEVDTGIIHGNYPRTRSRGKSNFYHK
jgi:hypothetical protein